MHNDRSRGSLLDLDFDKWVRAETTRIRVAGVIFPAEATYSLVVEDGDFQIEIYVTFGIPRISIADVTPD